MTDVEGTGIAAWLGLEAPVSLNRIGEGQSNLTQLAVDVHGRRAVLRRPPGGPLLASAHDIEREYRILRALEGSAVPTPPVLGFAEPTLLATGFVDGLAIGGMEDALALDPAVRQRLGFALVPALAAIHAVDLAATGLVALASPRPYAARQLRGWRAQADPAWPETERIARRLERAIPEQRELTLVHGDFHIRNVIAAPDGAAIRAVLDWELCTLGDPLADLGTLLAYWWQPGDYGAPVHPETSLPGFPARCDLVDAYALETGRDVCDLPFWHALALWKVAVICQGILRRAQADPRSAPPSGPPSLELVHDLLERASRVLDGEIT